MDINPSTNPEPAHLPLTRLSPIHWFEILQFSAVCFNINPDHIMLLLYNFFFPVSQHFVFGKAICVEEADSLVCREAREVRLSLSFPIRQLWNVRASEPDHVFCGGFHPPLCDWFILGKGQPSSPLLYIHHSSRLLSLIITAPSVNIVKFLSVAVLTHCQVLCENYGLQCL